MSTLKIAGYQDGVKKNYESSFAERVNIMCDEEAKRLIKEQILLNGRPPFPFHLQSPTVFNQHNKILHSTDSIADEIYAQVAAPYLVCKLRIASLEEVDCPFQKTITNILSDSMRIWLSKCFTNFSGAVHQLHRQGLLQTDKCRMCNTKPEVDTLHALAYEHSVFQNCRNEVVTTLQLKVLRLLDEDMFPPHFLE